MAGNHWFPQWTVTWSGQIYELVPACFCTPKKLCFGEAHASLLNTYVLSLTNCDLDHSSSRRSFGGEPWPTCRSLDWGLYRFVRHIWMLRASYWRLPWGWKSGFALIFTHNRLAQETLTMRSQMHQFCHLRVFYNVCCRLPTDSGTLLEPNRYFNRAG